MKNSTSTRSQKGLTLIELVIALGVMAVLSTATLLASEGLQRRTLNNASLGLQADFRRAQQMALIEGRRWRVRFDLQHNRYFVHSVPMAQAEYVYTIYLPRGVEISAFSHSFLEYLPRGTVSSGFSIELRKGRFMQRQTATVGAGRIRVKDIQRLGG